MKKTGAALLLIGLGLSASAAPAAAAKEKAGARVAVELAGGRLVEGELIAVRAQSLVVADPVSLASSEVPLAEIFRVKVIRKTRLLKGLGLGSLIGAGASWVGIVAIGRASGSTGDFMGGAKVYVGLTAYGAVLGLVVGALAASISGQDQTINWAALSSSERKAALRKLRKMSRFPKECL